LRLSHRELNRAVLARQHLIERLPAGTGAAAAVASIGSLQVQYNPSPFLALRARVEGEAERIGEFLIGDSDRDLTIRIGQ